MNIRTLLLLLSSGVIIFLSGVCHAGSKETPDRKQSYELRERCNDAAKQFFHRRYGSGYDKMVMKGQAENYVNHYNTKLNKCFALIIINTKNEKENVWGKSKELWDIGKTGMVGLFSEYTYSKDIFFCTVNEVDCKSEKEWDMLIAPYISD